MTEQPENTESPIEHTMFNLKDLDDIDSFEKLKPILTAMLQNVSVLNYMVAIVIEQTGVSFSEDDERHPNNQRDTGGYI